MPRTPSRWLAILTTLAVVNLGAGLWLSLQPARLLDLRQIVNWAEAWGAGANPYAAAGSTVDYPPWALVMLWPLSILPESWRWFGWPAVNLGLLLLLIAVLVRQGREPGRQQVALGLLLAATAPARTLGQFSLLSYALAIGGGFSRGPVLGGLAVGLSLLKPQVGGVVLLWVILRRDWRRAGVALAVPLVLTVAYAWRAHVGPATVIHEYLQVLGLVHGAFDPLPGHTELAAWLMHLFPAHAGGLLVAGALASVMAIPAVVFAMRVTRWPTDMALDVLALCGTASLLAVRHLSYDLILLWPAVVAWRVPPFSLERATATRLAVFIGLAGLLVIEPPAWARLAVSYGGPMGLMALTQTDRIVAVLTWGILSWRILRKSRSSVADAYGLV